MKTIAILGLGNRGGVYGKYLAQNKKVEIVSVCDISKESLKKAEEDYKVAKENLFTDENEFFASKRADVLVIATLDCLHYTQTIRALKLGYDILLEKPVSPIYEECEAIAELAEQLGRKVVICHNLRYTPFYQTLKRLVVNGEIGELISVEQAENIGYAHYMCSFIRGKWRRKDETSPLILQKCCHDLDIINWIVGKKCENLSSYGDLLYYTPKNAPIQAKNYCVDCADKTCPYNGTVFYIQSPESLCVPYGFDYSEENIMKYLGQKDHNYGKCVFRSDNDVCDRQVVTMRFEDGIIGSLFVHGFAHQTHRLTKIYGTLGVIEGSLEEGIITVRKYGKRAKKIDVNKSIKSKDEHSGGDAKLVEDFVS